MSKVKALVLTGFGLNCDNETAHAFKLAGGEADKVHINDLISGDASVHDYNILAFGGGFSWGDDHGAGVLQAVRMKSHFGEDLVKFLENDKLIIGICNGFQTLVNIGLLPGFEPRKLSRELALIHNDKGNFIDKWVDLKTESNSKCVFTKGMENFQLPIRHGEGKFYTDEKTLEKLEANNQVALRYSNSDGTLPNGKFPENPNGSLNDIAGVCDSTGRVFGLMPHPEAFVNWTHHPMWPEKKHSFIKEGKNLFESETPDGLNIFKNAIEYFAG